MRFMLQNGTAGQSVIFYETVSGTIHLMILTNTDGHWQRIYRQSMGKGKEIKLALLNAGPGHAPRLVLTVEHAPQDQLIMLAMEDGKVVRLLTASFDGWVRGYFDNQLHMHLAFVQFNSQLGQNQLVNYIVSEQHAPILTMRRSAATSAGNYLSLHRQEIFLRVPGIDQLTTQEGFDSASATIQSSGNQMAFFSLSRKVQPTGPLFGAARSSARMMRRLIREPFYPINQGLPAERYYNSNRHFFIDFPINTAGNLSLAEETETHILFTRKDTGSSYLAVYWIPKLQWTRGSYIDWIRLGDSDQFVFAAPSTYKEAAHGIHFGVYDDVDDY